MSKQEKKSASTIQVPSIRFKQDDGSDFPDWEEKRLGEVADIVRGASPRPISSSVWFDDTSNVGWVRISDVTKSNVFLTETVQKLSLSGIKKSRFVPINSVIMSICATIGVPIVTKIDVCVHDGFVVFSNLKMHNIFTFYLLKSIENKWKQYRQPGTQFNLNTDIVMSEKLNFPTLPEQQKISSFLQNVDTKIQLLERKVTLLQSYKKGIMQKLFSQELRFKDEQGNEYPDWQERRLRDMVTKVSSDITLDSLKELRGTYAVYGATGEIKRIDFFRETEPYIAIVKDGAGVGRVHLCSPYSSVLGTLDIIKPKKEKVTVYFLYSVLQRIVFSKYIIGSTIPHIYFKEYSNEKITLPPLPEQQKIGSFLQSLDTKISLTQKQVMLTKQYKKGLLQRMFV